MTGAGSNRPAARLLAVCWLMLVAVSTAAAGPIQPDIERLVREAQEPALEFAPARAGWNGPETAAGAALAPSLGLDASYQARLARASLRETLVPEPRILAALAVLILLLRWRLSAPQPAVVQALPRAPSQPPDLRQAA